MAMINNPMLYRSDKYPTYRHHSISEDTWVLILGQMRQIRNQELTNHQIWFLNQPIDRTQYLEGSGAGVKNERRSKRP